MRLPKRAVFLWVLLVLGRPRGAEALSLNGMSEQEVAWVVALGAAMVALFLVWRNFRLHKRLEVGMEDMERTVRQSGSVSYAASPGKHDDLVAALGLCLFGLRRFPGLDVRRAGPQRPVPSAAAWT